MAAGVIIGAAVAATGQIIANKKQADAEKENAKFLHEQSEFEQRFGEEQEKLFRIESDEFIASQESAFAKAGVDISGSPLLKLADTRKKVEREVRHIRNDALFRRNLAMFRAMQASGRADQLIGLGTTSLIIGQAGASAASTLLTKG